MPAGREPAFPSAAGALDRLRGHRGRLSPRPEDVTTKRSPGTGGESAVPVSPCAAAFTAAGDGRLLPQATP
ncbi:MAG: hypothetical protein HY369_01295 [Candidatus Aenigmarchaeota archaeon]|nr:hypothetical protein [Candidatus Aenigmarchaeota archaeon]